MLPGRDCRPNDIGVVAVSPSRPGLAAISWPDVGLAALVGAVALLVRWPYLWTIPRFTDETLEVLHSLAILRDGARPLTNYDSYYGALYNYVVALALWLGGESPFAPRLVVLLAGALTVAATYALGRELALQVMTRPDASGASPRLVGLFAALLLAANGQHVVVTSHIAWSNCLTPLLTALGCWAVLRATRPNTNDAKPTVSGPALVLAGLAFGAALQTHPLVATILPGVALGVLWHRVGLLRTRWPYLAAALFLIGYANVLAYNLQTGFESLGSARRISAEYARDQQATAGYLPTAGSMGLLLLRTLGGAVDQRADTAEYLADPLTLATAALALGGLLWLAWRGRPLPLLLVLSALLLLPAVNSKFRILLTSRYLMPLVPLLFASASLALASLVGHARASLARSSGVPGRPAPATGLLRRLVVPSCLGISAMLVLGQLPPLARYYDRALARTDTNERILRLSDEIVRARGPAEVVLVDDAIGTELPDTGVTELRGLEYLLVVARVPYRVVRPSPGRLQDELRDAPSVLAVLSARDAGAAAGRVSVTPLDPRPPAESGRMGDYRLYRLTRAGA